MDDLRHHGHARLLLLQALTALGGAFGFGWEIRFLHETDTVLAGISGCIYGLLAAQLGNIVLNWSAWGFYRRAWYTSVLVCATLSDVVVDIVMYSPEISYSAHVGGFVTGALVGLVVMRDAGPGLTRCKAAIELVAVMLFLVFFASSITNMLIA